jgi:hypothetical protein
MDPVVATQGEGLTAHELRSLLKQPYSSSTPSSRLEAMSDLVLEEESRRAGRWIYNVLRNHVKLLSKKSFLCLFRFAVEKETADAQETWSEMEKLYMALTNPDLPDAKQRADMSLLLVMELNFANRLADIDRLISERIEADERAIQRESEATEVRELIFERASKVKVDHFACAISLAMLKLRPDIVDENEGCCPVCQNSYTDLSTNTVEELELDYPVRIKYCGHIIGKACLEQWMSTPKIDAAKYPHRTCPLCRIKIEGIPAPRYPTSLNMHVRSDRRAMETMKELTHNWDLETDECMDTIAACMSEEIACEELLGVIKKAAGSTRWGFEKDEKRLRNKLEELKKEKWVWGFRGDGMWKLMRNEWKASGVVRKE